MLGRSRKRNVVVAEYFPDTLGLSFLKICTNIAYVVLVRLLIAMVRRFIYVIKCLLN